MLADCHVGTRIISTKAYATGTKRVNMRNLGDVESIMEVSQLKTVKQPTSWTPNNVPYYLHTVTHSKVCACMVLVLFLWWWPEHIVIDSAVWIRVRRGCAAYIDVREESTRRRCPSSTTSYTLPVVTS
ncbi:hypothetical protein ANCCAN_27416 [Ancylostoma caninum]|uniref:Histone-lysine N-methyltransferase, H3 lysine-79 specific n=1 Tax=Ancylostoma caninum TaxID=29170 RepID=A0A368F7D4_ANCCA|nr:hypothetical protein ANCCAN_27416 [Ancylostoma caninum]